MNKKNLKTDVTSPCISQCCLNESDVCVGCFRHLDEITGWHSATNEEKKKILVNCASRKLDLNK